MRASVVDAWLNLNVPLEGMVTWMYLDIRGLVTTGVGNYLPSAEYAIALPWVRKSDGSPATKDEVRAEYESVLANKALAKLGHLVAGGETRLRLTGDGVKELVERKLMQNYVHVSGRFPEFDSWPAPAQAAVMSLAWACGPAFRFPKLEAHLRAQNWSEAATEIVMNEVTPEGKRNAGLRPRNAMNVAMMKEAAEVKSRGLDYEILRYPHQVSRDEEPVGCVKHEEEPQPIVHDINSYFGRD